MRRAGRMAMLWRGIWLRRGLSAGVLLMAVVAVAAAALGPSYHDAGSTYAIRKAFAEAPADARAMEITTRLRPGEDPPLPSSSFLDTTARQAIRGHERLFQPVVRELRVSPARLEDARSTIQVAWREGVCARLTLTAGQCPQDAGEIVISADTAERHRWRIGSPVVHPFLNGPALIVVGVYTVKDPHEGYWFGEPPTGTAAVGVQVNQLSPGEQKVPVERAYATEDTLKRANAKQARKMSAEGKIWLPFDVAGLRAADLPVVNQSIRQVAGHVEQGRGLLSFRSGSADVLAGLHTSLRTLQVPVLVVTLQLAVLCWLLLFFLTTDIAQARAPDIALVKLRGLTGLRLLTFGLAEPVLLLLLALPLGVFISRTVVVRMSDVLFGSDIPVGFPVTVWLAAAGAGAGGLVAVVLASRAALTQPVTDQWRRATRGRRTRGWVPEAILLTLVVGGLVQVVGSGALESTGRQNAVSLLVPGLAAIAAALVAARLIPPACRALFGRTRRRGGIGLFLALRQIARRPGGTRITVALATSFALAVFAVTAWSVARDNHREVARTQLGAPVVLTVTAPSGQTLTEFVRAADPSGRAAAAVLRTQGSADYPVTVAVDAQRFANVAYWRSDFADRPLGPMLAELAASSARLPPPVILHGDQIRMDVQVTRMAPYGAVLKAAVLKPGADRPTELSLGVLPRSGRLAGTASLTRCGKGCELRRIFLGTPPGRSPEVLTGELTIKRIDERTAGQWRRVDAGLADQQRWRAIDPAGGDITVYRARHTASPAGLKFTFQVAQSLPIAVEPAAYPTIVPAITTAKVVTPGSIVGGPDGELEPFGVSRARGLNDQRLDVRTLFPARTLPAAGVDGLIVDELMARRAAGSIDDGTVRRQIWTTPAAAPGIKAKIRAARMTVLSEQTAVRTAAGFGKNGPGLALTLMLAAAVAAAILAAAEAMLSLYVSGRRRTYELAALRAAGASRRSLRLSLLLEQSVILGVGATLGVATGLIVIWLALPSVPQFSHPPPAPALRNAPDPLLLTGVTVAALGSAFAGAWLMSRSIMSRVRPDLLREAPP